VTLATVLLVVLLLRVVVAAAAVVVVVPMMETRLSLVLPLIAVTVVTTAVRRTRR
jgi:hypothetical protein